jgi:hypothetical protein
LWKFEEEEAKVEEGAEKLWIAFISVRLRSWLFLRIQSEHLGVEKGMGRQKEDLYDTRA